ncbi:MAG: dihydropteroate synthase [Desulfovibrio sp.]|jgi:dihydropteroate synthase|nr:dihydropteroate synthase [Desulfovibrio sp.]
MPDPAAQNAAWRSSGGHILASSAFFGVMGIVNLTPDSFYDGGRCVSTGSGLARALRLYGDGADIVDFGAETTKPGSEALSPEEEQARLLPVLRAARGASPDMVVSVDTYHAGTAAAALDLGAAVINDVSACSFDPGLTDVLVQYKPGYVLMHHRGRPKTMQDGPRYDDVRREVASFFEREMTRLVKAGLPEDRIALDPGIGFGKTCAHNVDILAHPGELLSFGRPVLVGISMKSVFGDLLGLPADDRGMATQVATALLWSGGIFWHRVHDVAATRQSLALAAALRPEQCERASV